MIIFLSVRNISRGWFEFMENEIINFNKMDINSTNSTNKTRLANYTIDPEPIGKGMFSTVHKGYDHCNNIYAIKKIDLNNITEEIKDKFLIELEISKMLNHENIVKCYDTFKTKRHFYIILELCDDNTLKNFIKELKNKKQSYQEKEYIVKKCIYQLKKAFEYLREKNIFHRDLKPENILFKYDSNNKKVLKLVDFGFAKYSKKQLETGEEYMSNTYCGSPIYMAPEVLIEGKYTSTADLWSIGIIMYELLYGHNPFNSLQSVQQLCQKIKAQQINFPQFYSEKCLNLIKSLLIVDPVERIEWAKFFNHEWFEEFDNLQKINNLNITSNMQFDDLFEQNNNGPIDDSINNLNNPNILETINLNNSYAFKRVERKYSLPNDPIKRIDTDIKDDTKKVRSYSCPESEPNLQLISKLYNYDEEYFRSKYNNCLDTKSKPIPIPKPKPKPISKPKLIYLNSKENDDLNNDSEYIIVDEKVPKIMRDSESYESLTESVIRIFSSSVSYFKNYYK